MNKKAKVTEEEMRAADTLGDMVMSSSFYKFLVEWHSNESVVMYSSIGISLKMSGSRHFIRGCLNPCLIMMETSTVDTLGFPKRMQVFDNFEKDFHHYLCLTTNHITHYSTLRIP